MGWGLKRYLGNEHEVGQGIKDSGVPRESIFITSKLWNTHQSHVAEGLQKTLDTLGTDYLDLYVSILFSLGHMRYGCQ
jgi:glycerol 2-dehydrogenase (NADP+)